MCRGERYLCLPLRVLFLGTAWFLLDIYVDYVRVCSNVQNVVTYNILIDIRESAVSVSSYRCFICSQGGVPAWNSLFGVLVFCFVLYYVCTDGDTSKGCWMINSVNGDFIQYIHFAVVASLLESGPEFPPCLQSDHYVNHQIFLVITFL